MRHHRRPARIQSRGSARQGRFRGERARAGGNDGHGPRPARPAYHGQPIAGGSAEGGLALRPADRSRASRGDGCLAARGNGRNRGARRTLTGRLPRAGRGRPSRSAGRGRGGLRPHLSRRLRRGGRVGRRRAGHRTAEPARPRQSLHRTSRPSPGRARQHLGGHGAEGLRRGQGPREGKACTGDRGRRTTPPADGRPPR